MTAYIPVLSFDLPLPPSANACWRNGRGGKGRFRTDVYKAWLLEAGAIICARYAQAGKPVVGKGYSIKISAGVTRRRDLDNIAKPTIDTLVTYAELPDDRWLDRIVIDRQGPEGRVWVTVIGGVA
jgi:Holliday junction resolvase RusA-like endonuclease